MRRRNWKAFRPTSLCEAIEACTQFALERHNRSIDRIADLMGIASKWTLYKYIQSGGMPARLIPAFEHACGCRFVTAYLGAAAGKLLIDFPTGRTPKAEDIQTVQAACNDAIGALLAFARQDADADSTLEALRHALQLLAHEHANVERHLQPELGFEEGQ